MEKQEVTLEFIRRAMAIFNSFEGPGCDELWWRTDGEYAPITLLVNCNDLFAWACADCVRLTPDNVEVLEKAAADIRAVSKDGNYREAGILFCCRFRGYRPQRPYYKGIDKELWPLFDACGPEVGSSEVNPARDSDTA